MCVGHANLDECFEYEVGVSIENYLLALYFMLAYKKKHNIL